LPGPSDLRPVGPERVTPVTTFVALLRGINVGPSRRIAMSDLRRAVESLGHRRVETYLQSGNIVFDAAGDDPVAVCAQFEDRLEGEIGQRIPILVMTADELRRIVRDEPFLSSAACESRSLHATLLFDASAASDLDTLDLPAATGERAARKGRVIYLCLPGGYGRTKLNNAYLERTLRARATTRNWSTMLALAALAEAHQPRTKSGA
jgi:uncharacterized protein (DUF1697 family)